jgi:transketolase
VEVLFQSLQDDVNVSNLRSHLISTKRSILKMHHKSQTSHVGSSLSCADILFHLCREKQFREKDEALSGIEILLSKGHAASAFYAALAEIGQLSSQDLDRYCADGSQLYGHLSHMAHSWIPLSTGSLGHGLPFGLGMALADRLKNLGTIVSVLISDGEVNEGTTWESALIASALNLNLLVCFIDANGIQSLDLVENILPLEPLAVKWKAFGWNVYEIDGHDSALLSKLHLHESKPTVVILRTVKGKGVSFMENKLVWHYRSPNEEELGKAFQELNEN